MAGLLLSDMERKLLEEYSLTSSGVQQRRTHLILLYDDGLLTHQAAEQAGFSRSQARYWKHQFLMDGLSIFSGLTGDKDLPDGLSDVAEPPKGIDRVNGDMPSGEGIGAAELPWPTAIKCPGILANDSLAEAGRKTWLYQFAEMIRNEESDEAG